MSQATSEAKIRAAQASIMSLSIFVALSAGIVACLIVKTDFDFSYNAATVASASFVVAISSFLLAVEFFIQSIYHIEHIDYFGFIGAASYGIGLMSMVVGISLAIAAFGMCALSYLLLSLLLVGYGVYYGIRVRKVGVEAPRVWRVSLRAVYFLLLIVGYILVSTVGG